MPRIEALERRLQDQLISRLDRLAKSALSMPTKYIGRSNPDETPAVTNARMPAACAERFENQLTPGITGRVRKVAGKELR